MSSMSPVTLEDWESKLVDYFLRFSIDGDAQDIRWFEVTPSTLAAAFADSDIGTDELEGAFQACMSRIPDLPQRLERGMMERSNDKSPGYFTYLVMTLLISSQFDAQEESNDFRLKLQNWLRTEHTYQNLSGVNAMWQALAEWLEQRIRKGESYRRLNLPEIPASWSHIGYTLRLTFPRKADLRLMNSVLTSHPQAISSPRLLIEYFQSAFQKENASHALKQAFGEFKDAWFSGRRTLADMPFWRLRQRAMELFADIDMHKAIIDMRVDFDNTRCYSSATDKGDDSVFAPSLSEALTSVAAGSSENLGKAVQNGLLFFYQLSHGRWRAIVAPDMLSPRFHIALSCKHSIRISKYLNSTIIEDDWLLTKHPQSRHVAMEILRDLKVSSGSQDELISSPQFYDGIRVPGGWLGLPEFLPSIESDAQNYRIYPSGESHAKISVGKADGRLMSAMPLNGEYVIEPELERGELTPSWRRRARFFDHAVPHPSLGQSSRYRLERLTDCVISPLKTPIFHANVPHVMEDADLGCEHLLEAVYANGASGWEEIELIALLNRIANDVSVWHLIRCLHDAGLIVPRLREAWKGRVWTLVKPSLVQIRNGENKLVVVEGATCLSLINDFQKAVSGLGGKCFRHCGLSVWSPPVLGAEIEDPVALSRLMEWPLVDAQFTSDITSIAFSPTTHTAELHIQVATRDWHSGSFLPHTDSNSETALLTRHVHPGARDHDLYRVISQRQTEFYLSRTAAIIIASMNARRPTFRCTVENRFICIADDCGLPDAMASALRRSLLRNGGPTKDGYVYPLDDVSFRWLNRLLPGCFISLQLDDDYDVNHLVSLARHSGGKTRLGWSNGRLALWAGK